MTDLAVPPEPQATARERRLKRWLIASVALNLLVAGAIGGSMMMAHRHHGSWRGSGGSTDSFGLMGFSRLLPDDRKREIRKGLAEMRRVVKPYREEFWDAKSEPAKSLAVEPLDKERLAAAFAKIDAAEAKLKAVGRERLVAILESMTAAERAQLAQRWQERKARRYGKRASKQKPDKE